MTTATAAFDLGFDLGPVVFWLTIVSVVSLVLSALFLPRVIANLPTDYFVVAADRSSGERGWQPGLVRVARNTVGVLLIVAGVVMLVIPGQGILTIIVGVVLTDLPGKRRLEQRLFRLPGVRPSLQWIRKKKGAPPFA